MHESSLPSVTIFGVPKIGVIGIHQIGYIGVFNVYIENPNLNIWGLNVYIGIPNVYIVVPSVESLRLQTIGRLPAYLSNLPIYGSLPIFGRSR